MPRKLSGRVFGIIRPLDINATGPTSHLAPQGLGDILKLQLRVADSERAIKKTETKDKTPPSSSPATKSNKK